MMFLILLNGKKVKVDSSVFPFFSQFKWNENKGYAQATTAVNPLRKSERRLHRLLMNAKPSEHVDHINGDPLDCRIKNLRIVTRQQNMWNRKTHKNNRSGVSGVVFLGKKNQYRAQVRKDGKLIYFGHYETLKEAKEAVVLAKKVLFGKFVRSNL